MRFAFGDRRRRDSTSGALIRILAKNVIRHARERIISDKSELLLGMGINRGLDLSADFWGGGSQVGESG